MLKTPFKLLLCISLLFSSCHSDDKEIIDEEPEPVAESTTFSFVKIEYIYDDISSIKEVTKELYPIVYSNYTSVKQTYVFKPAEHIYEKSMFWSRDTRAFLFTDKELKVITPSVLSEKGNIVYDDGTRWLYSEIDEKLRPNINAEYSFEIEPGQQIVLRPTFILKDIGMSYRLHLKGNEENEELIIDGLWGGSMYIDHYLN